MSVQLWRFYLENDVDKFRQFLAEANYTNHLQRAAGASSGPNAPFKAGSPSTLATSPRTPMKMRKSSENKYPGSHGKASQMGGQNLSRADINSKDSVGCTILHHAASSVDENAYSFIQALLEAPFVDLYTQDAESGWTALHRALYFGNISAAQAIMLRDVRDATDFTSGIPHAHTGGLIKIKDHEGNSPFEVYGLTVSSRDLHRESQTIGGGLEDDDTSSNGDAQGDPGDERPRTRTLKPRINLLGDDVFTFGSNKNLTLGLGDEDDRQFPERPPFDRPTHLLQRFHQEHIEKQAQIYETHDLSSSQLISKDDLPSVIKYHPLLVQDIVMSKLHTAILTNDPESNLFMSGFGPGGRLGTGDETTRFKFVCIESGGLAGKKVIEVALGQDHTIALSDKGEVFTWGSNKFGQLGYTLPPPSSGQDVPAQLLPRQLFGSTKKEVIIGAAASAVHSAIFTSTSLYTFGKNDGQLGLMDADARSLEIQTSPRRVGVNLIQSSIEAVSAIDQATIVLLESHDVIVFTNYGWTKVLFPLESFDRRTMSGTVPNQYLNNNVVNHITKVTSGGSTICALSSFGEVFTVDVTQRADPRAAGTSTTHPTKAKNALPTPSRIWSIKKSHMAARDVAVGQNGSIIICTDSGSVWRKEKRAKLKDVDKKGTGRTKDYKFVRVPTLTRVVAVRSNAFGAFAAVRKDTNVTREQIDIDPPTLWGDLFPLLPFRHFKLVEDSDEENPQPRFWTPYPSGNSPATIKQAILLSKDIETEIQDVLQRHEPLSESSYDVWIVSNVSDVRIPAHSFLLAARSSVLRRAFNEFQHAYYFSIPDVLSIEYDKDGQVQLLFHGADFITLLNLVFYVYCEYVVDIWHHIRRSPESAARYRQIRRELMDISQRLEMKGLESAARLQVDPGKRLHLDMEIAFADEDFFFDGDVAIQLANDVEIKAHSALVCLRCPFFEGMFHGRAAGKWIASRRDQAIEAAEAVKVNLDHIDPDIFTLVLRHIYTDAGEELFDEVVTKDLDDFLDIVLEVMSVANELMLDRLAQISQKVLGQYVDIRNVCYLLNAVAPCNVTEFKKVCLEYICLNLEVMLSNRLLEELDEDLLYELDAVVQSNQIENSLIARSGKADEELFEAHPELAAQIELARKRKIDSMRLKTRLHEDEERASKFRVGSVDKSPNLGRRQSFVGKMESASPGPSPALRPKASTNDLLFDMDDDVSSDAATTPGLGISISPQFKPQDVDDLSLSGTPKENEWTDVRRKSTSRSFVNTLSSLDESPSVKPRSSAATNIDSRPLTTTTGFISTGSKPWASAPMAEKTNLKDILAQSSSTQVSNLSLGIQSSEPEAVKPTFGTKMSQKERKKMMQQQNQERLEAKPVTTPWTPESQKSSKGQSPWQAVRTPSAPATGSPSQASVPVNSPSRPPPRPGMTLRQTVAGAPSLSKAGSSQTTTQGNPPASQSSRPSTSTPQPTPPSKATSTAQAVPTPAIQSIRHIPPPSQPSFTATSKTSLLDILNQQQSEKKAIVEARTSKKSLQDIQAEQEFQAWWDEESKKAIAEQEAMTRAAKNSLNGGNRGKGRRGRGRGGKAGTDGPEQDVPKVSKSGDAERQKAQPSQPSTSNTQKGGNPAPSSQTHRQPLPLHSRGGGGERRGGGRGRGRGRGGSHPS